MSLAVQISLITATMSTPFATRIWAFSAVIPPIAQTGISRISLALLIKETGAQTASGFVGDGKKEPKAT